MSTQTVGLTGWFVGGMIRRSIRTRLRNLYWSPPKEDLSAPVIFYCNHHGWQDGYVMFHVVEKLKLKALDWIQEFDTFPLFSKVGGMRYPADDPTGRAQTIRRTIRLMNQNKWSLMISRREFCTDLRQSGPSERLCKFLRRRSTELRWCPPRSTTSILSTSAPKHG